MRILPLIMLFTTGYGFRKQGYLPSDLNPVECGLSAGVSKSNICDPENYLSQQSKNVLESLTKMYKNVQLLLVVVNSINNDFVGYDSNMGATETFARQIHNVWGVDDPAIYNGVLILLSIDGRSVAISTASGVGKVLTRDAIQSIISHMKEDLHKGDYEKAIETCMVEINLILNGKSVTEDIGITASSFGSDDAESKMFGLYISRGGDSQPQFIVKPDNITVPFDFYDINSWKSLAPDLHVGDMDFITKFSESGVIQANGKERERIERLILVEGYAHLGPFDFNLEFDKMTNLMDRFAELGLPMPLVFIYDEFWLVFLKLHKLIETIIGKGYYRLPDMWAWRIDPSIEDRGWNMHRDKTDDTLFPNGMPETLTVWVPLSEATTLNGCMYILPADRDPTYRKHGETLLNNSYWPGALADVRALPAAAGQPLFWNQMVWHWGSHASSRAEKPRYSISIEFQSKYASKMYNSPVTNPLWFPDFEYRLKLAARQILQFRHMTSKPHLADFIAIDVLTTLEKLTSKLELLQ